MDQIITRAAVPHTGVYLGKWRTVDGLQEDWEYENLLPSPGNIIEQIPLAPLLPQLIMGAKLGGGGSGQVFQCYLMTSYSGDTGLKPLVVKLYTKLIASKLLRVEQGKPIMVVNPRNDKRFAPMTETCFKYFEIENAKLFKAASLSLFLEVLNFQSIYETDFQLAKFRGAERVTDISDSDLLLMQDQLRKLKLHPGRKHIHQILHFDKVIPAILSERCDGTLRTLRISKPALFECIPELSPTWKKVGHELASAIQYIESRDMVHVDIKPSNVFFVWAEGQPIVKLGDFGLCRTKQGPVTYIKNSSNKLPLGDKTCIPKGWPKNKFDFDNTITLNAETLCHAEFAVTMFRILYVPQAPTWPDTYCVIEDEIDQVSSQFEWGQLLFSHDNNNLLIQCLLHMLLDWRELIHKDNSVGIQQFYELTTMTTKH